MKLLSWILVAVGIAGLVAVRVFEDKLFYDPFLQYFHEADKAHAFPQLACGRLLGSYLLRFSLNLVFSLLIIHFMFRNRRWTGQAAVLILLVFAITFPIYLYCIYSKFSIGYLFSFYIRRFVIQPVTVLLLVPVFYYRKQLLKKAGL